MFAVEPPVDPAVWRRLWQQHQEKFAEPRRYRFGAPFSPATTLAEAEASDVSTVARRSVLRELAVLSRGASRLEPHDWVARQRAELGALAERFRQVPAYPTGRWAGARAP